MTERWQPSTFAPSVLRADLGFGDFIFADPMRRTVEYSDVTITPDQAREFARALIEAAALADRSRTTATLRGIRTPPV